VEVGAEGFWPIYGVGAEVGAPPRNVGLQAKMFEANPRTLLPETGPAPKELGIKSRLCPTLVLTRFIGRIIPISGIVL
jgi:hypothetical protein